MTASATMRVATPPTAASSTVKAGQAYNLTLTILNHFDDTDEIVLGVSASQPATYGDMTNPNAFQVNGVQQFSFRAGDPNDVATVFQAFPSNTWVAGNKVWVCIFAGPGIPSSGDAPLMVAGSFVVV